MKCLVLPALCIVAAASFQQMPFTTRPRLMMNGFGVSQQVKTNSSPLFSSDRPDYSQEELDNHANQMNPNNDEYDGDDDDDDEDYEYSQEELDNNADQMNPNNDEYYNSRGW
jgi:hypothetical protein